MSTTIDQRVVEMRFDNKHFETNAATTMSTLEKLKQRLNLDGATKGLENVGSAAKNVNMVGLSNAVEAVQSRFSALQVVGVTALANITNSAVNAGKRMLSALTIDPIKTGFSEYETKINSIQTIMSNTASKGTTMEDVTRVIGELNTYADKTIYNFAEMTRNIGTFTAAGVGLEESAAAIQGIANLAAASGSTSQQASTAMYQLSQALASGTVKLMDWNSVVNAGMGGEKFQEALKATAREHGMAVDDMIAKNGSFRESLQEGWLTADVLNTTLQKFTVEGAKEYAKTMVESGKYTQEQADALIEEAQAMEDAATKVKTFTQLWDTLKESAQSGWAQSWEIIVGDFEEAKALFSEVGEVLGGIIESSANARNAVLQGWKDLGGRTAIIDAIKNTFNGLISVIKPISEAFREIFPPITAEQLTAFSTGLRDLTAKFTLSESASENLKQTFKGLFSIFDTLKQLLSAVFNSVSPLLGGIGSLAGKVLEGTAAFGTWLLKINEFVKQSDIFNTVLGAIVGFASSAIDAIKNFAKVIGSNFVAPGLELLGALLDKVRERISAIGDAATGMKSGTVTAIEAMGTTLANCEFFKLMKTLWDGVKKIGSGLAEAFGELTSGIIDKISNADFKGFFDIINSLIAGGVGVGIMKFLESATDVFSSFKDVTSGIVDIFDGVRGCLEAYQTQLKANTLMKIASAIGILAAAVVVLSLIDSEKLSEALGAMTVMFADLLGSMAIFEKISGDMTGAVKASTVMIAMSTAVLILASALKQVAELDPKSMITGLVGIIGLTGTIVGAAKIMSSGEGTIVKGAAQMVIFAAAVKILASACADLSVLSRGELTKGLVGVGVLLGEISLFLNTAKFSGKSITTATGIVILSSAITVLASACADFASMSLEEIIKGLVSVGVLLLEIAAFTKITGNASHVISTGAALVVIAAGMKVLASACADFASMSLEEIIKGLVAMAVAFGVLGVAGAVLKPLVPTILGLAASFALIGAATLGIGAGLTLVGAGLSAIAVGISAVAMAGAGGATAIAAALTVIITSVASMIPAVVTKIGEGIIAFCNVIAEGAPAIDRAIKAVVLSLIDVLVECIPAIADGALKLIDEVLKSLVGYTPSIVDSLFDFVIGLLDGLTSRIPELIESAANVFASIFTGIVDALQGLGSDTLMKGLVGAGLLAGVLAALSALTSLIPGAMVGVLGVGAVIAEMALVIAAVGALAQLPGLEWLINEGGNLMQAIGTAIGQFVGGIIGGVAQGVTSSLPQIGSDLSEFMTNAQPFIEGARNINSQVLDGVKAIASTILVLTSANLLEGIASFITGSSSIDSFGAKLPVLGNSITQFADSLGTFDDTKVSTIECASKAIKVLADAASSLPNEGGWAAAICGDNSLATFSGYLPQLGTDLNKFASNLGTFTSDKVSTIDSAVKAIKAFASLADADLKAAKNNIDGFGGKLDSFAKDIKKFCDSMPDGGNVDAATNSVKKILDAVKGITNANSESITKFTKSLSEIGKNGVDAFVEAFTGTASRTDVLKAGNELILSVVDGVKAKLPVVKDTITTTTNTAVTAIRNTYSNFHSAGMYVVTGFANGISANTFMAVAKARAMANAAEQAARSELQINSPSKIFKAIGMSVPEGLALGISNYRGLAEIKKSLRDLSNVIDLDMDVDPTIRPVLDLSDVESKAGLLRSMVNPDSSIRAMDNAAAISTLMGSRGQNGDNSDVVDAIERLRKSKPESTGDTYYLGDIRYDDGSAVGEAVKQLIQAAKVDRRT